tara:strand:- start:503 stop:883 length:381 start_codon:yes stop_codon:yes gene_type:complete
MSRTQIRAELHVIYVKYTSDPNGPGHGVSFLEGMSFHDSKKEAMDALDEELEHLLWEHVEQIMFDKGISLLEALKLTEDGQEIEEYLNWIPYSLTSGPKKLPKIDLPDGIERWLPDCETVIGYATV